MKKILLMIIAVALAAAAAACGTQAQAAPEATQADVQRQYVEAYGIIKATEVKNITLDFQAAVTAINVKEGQKVITGQKLVSLDLSEINSQLASKELELNAAQNNIGRSRSNTELRKLQNDLGSARETYNKSLKELASKEELFKSGGISQSELDSFKKQVEGDKKAVADITFSIESTRNSKGSEYDQQGLDASILESDIGLLKSRLDKTYFNGGDIVSDVKNGLVYDIGYVQGDIAGPEKKILSLMDLDSLVVEANVPEEFIKDVRIGAEAVVIPTADKAKQYKGKVTRISGKAVHSNGETLIAVQISIEGRDEFLLPEFNVDVKIQSN